MGSFVILLLGGQVSSNVVFYGGYPSSDAALAAIIKTGKPWLYQVVQVWGPCVGTTSGATGNVTVNPGEWLAVTNGFAADGNPRLYAFGVFPSEAAANAAIAANGTPGAYSIGLVQAAI